jgi:hypothetical protein
MDINRELAERLGVHWHKDNGEGFCGEVCDCGLHLYDIECRSYTPVESQNPDFTSDPGKIELLRLMMKREDWPQFHLSLFRETAHGRMNDFIPIRFITDTTGLLAQAAVEFLRRESKFKQIETWEAQST